jgi:hypothetical protein
MRPIGNIRADSRDLLTGGRVGYRLRFARNGVMRTSPEHYATRAAASIPSYVIEPSPASKLMTGSAQSLAQSRDRGKARGNSVGKASMPGVPSQQSRRPGGAGALKAQQ